MPWQSAEIIVAQVTISSDKQRLELGAPIHVAGKTGGISAQDPNWNSNNGLFFISDISGYHNPWKFTFDPANPAETGEALPILPEPIKEEFGAPQWWLSRHGSGALSKTKVAFSSFRQGRSVLYICDVEQGGFFEVSTPFAHIQFMHGDGKSKVVMLGQSTDADEVLTELTMDMNGTPQLQFLSPPPIEGRKIPSSFISSGKHYAITLPPDNRTCHITYYPPKNLNYDGGLPGEKPPVIVLIHGGPFLLEPASLDWSKQFFTSRGWAQCVCLVITR
jgi:hypothetical protein